MNSKMTAAEGLHGGGYQPLVCCQDVTSPLASTPCNRLDVLEERRLNIGIKISAEVKLSCFISSLAIEFKTRLVQHPG